MTRQFRAGRDAVRPARVGADRRRRVLRVRVLRARPLKSDWVMYSFQKSDRYGKSTPTDGMTRMHIRINAGSTEY